MELPEGFEFHEGFDGFLVGLGIVFFVKTQRIVRIWLDYRLIPDWTYEPLIQLYGGLMDTLAALANPFSGVGIVGGVGTGGTGAGAGTGAGGPSISAVLDVPMLGSVVKLTGLPLVLFDALSASAFEQLLIVVGWWIAILVPLRWWLLRPALFWWQERRSSA